MDIQFINNKEWRIDKKGFDKYIGRLKKHVPDTEGVLNVVFVNDKYIQSLNKAYRKKDKPTDVLSFSYMTDELIGEIYISVETARKNIRAKQAPDRAMEPALQNELSKLFVHGFLHIFGHNHESDSDYKKMKKVEDEVLG